MPKESWKSQTWWSLPVYTGDVSGVCSALYELGGMVVMHDPSGCNSTYNTHDEIRWTTMESLIFLSGLTQLDAITGNDRKLVDDIVLAASQFHPAFIAIANSPVPWLIGTDFRAICSKVSSLTGIPAFHIETNAMHDYTKGAGQAFAELAKLLFSGKASFSQKRPSEKTAAEDPASAQEAAAAVTVQKDLSAIRAQKDISDIHAQEAADAVTAKKAVSDRICVNILGATPLDFTVRSQFSYLRSFLEKEGFDVLTVWAIGENLENLRHADQADVNLVISSVGIYAARWMEENLGIPFVAGMPTGAFCGNVCKALQETARSGVSCIPYLEVLEDTSVGDDVRTKEENTAPKKTVIRCFAGEPVTMGSLAAAKVLQDQTPCDLVPLTETVEGLVPQGCRIPKGEQQIADTLGKYQEVTADPMLKAACHRDCHFQELPHLALSGRLYLSEIPPLITE